jgi:hypothetical protein
VPRKKLKVEIWKAETRSAKTESGNEGTTIGPKSRKLKLKKKKCEGDLQMNLEREPRITLRE